MAAIRRRIGWELPETDATPESAFVNRRDFLRAAGVGTVGAIAAVAGCTKSNASDPPQPTAQPNSPTSGLYPAKRNAAFKLDRPLTEEIVAARHNNYYEFTTDKSRVWKLVDGFETRPWTVEVGGLVHKPQTFDIYDLVGKMPLEDRLYRFRCVEAWAMAVPWTGFTLKSLIDRVQVKSEAKFVRFVTVLRPEQMPGVRALSGYQWPYYEGLTMAEATNDLTLLATGIYGHELPVQHGAPVRLVVPWKYGFKSIKSIVRIEFTAEKPPTFWNDAVPREYGFAANVDPAVPHPRWSQANETMIGSGERRPTLPFNGYGEYVAQLYG